jgi:hypothetical protein
MKKSLIELEATFLVLLPDRDVQDVIKDLADVKEILLLSNLA